MITVICYGREQIWDDRNKAIAFYFRGTMCCDGNERRRYENVLHELTEGKMVCYDYNGD